MITTTCLILWIPSAAGSDAAELDVGDVGDDSEVDDVARGEVDDELHPAAAIARVAPAARSDQRVCIPDRVHRNCEPRVFTRR
jgi:hypothetical protein